MGIYKKIAIKTKELKGKAKKRVARETGDKELMVEGHLDVAESKVRQAVEKVKKAVKRR
ncbi:CsbD family protein [Nonomuraea sediminis]|uniref:CsbD family protein n=1 Tax=Nonomuraea sediminis TaxID=2835864 RepID=UPI001BDD9512|nr:CsbD family protein [Nonomuraea sediminis]